MQIPGTLSPRITAIDNAAEAYVKSRDRWMKLGEDVTQLRDALLAVTTKNADKLGPPNEVGELLYRLDEDLMLVLTPSKAKVRVKHVPDEQARE